MEIAKYTCMKCLKVIEHDLQIINGLPFHCLCVEKTDLSFTDQKKSFGIIIKFTFNNEKSSLDLINHYLTNNMEVSDLIYKIKNGKLNLTVISKKVIQMPNCLLIDYINKIIKAISTFADDINLGELAHPPLVTYEMCEQKPNLVPFFVFNLINEKIEKDIYSNYFELKIIKKEIIYNNENEINYCQYKNVITSKDIEECFLYHGVPSINNSDKKLLVQSSKFIFKGYYLTNNVFYSGFSGKKDYSPLKIGEEASIILCKVFYNKKFIQNILPLPKLSPKSILQNKGILYTFIGDSRQNYLPIHKDLALRFSPFAKEYIVNNCYQVIPLCKFQVIRKDYFILWKSDNVDHEIISKISNDLQVNFYTCKTDLEAIKIIRRKKTNRIRLIIDKASDLINEAREIVESNFLILIYGETLNDIEWAKQHVNVIVTTSKQKLEEYASLEMNENEIIRFVSELETLENEKFMINREEILNFPLYTENLPYDHCKNIRNMDKIML